MTKKSCLTKVSEIKESEWDKLEALHSKTISSIRTLKEIADELDLTFST